jgi:uridine phosphorylase
VRVSISGSLKSPAVSHREPIDPRSETRQGSETHRRSEDPIHLRPTTTLAERVLLPGDPGRALALAQFLLESPLMFNHHRGLWGYTGTAADGEPLTIQSTGMGGPSAAIVLHELILLGVTRAIRVGTCGAFDPALGLGDLVVAFEAIAGDGTSVALGADGLARADPGLADALLGALRHERVQAGEPATELAVARSGIGSGGRPCHYGRIVSTDLFYERDSQRNAQWSAAGALAVEMEAATLFAVGANAGIAVGCVLAVTDTFDATGNRTRIEDDALLGAVEAMGTAAAAALAV